MNRNVLHRADEGQNVRGFEKNVLHKTDEEPNLMMKSSLAPKTPARVSFF